MAFDGGPSDSDYVVIEAVAQIADELQTTSAAVSLARLRSRPGGVVPIVGARRVERGDTGHARSSAGTTVDGETSAVYPPLLQSQFRY